MKNLKSINYLYILLFCSTAFLSSCDLELQRGFDFEPEVDLTDPFADLTAWKWLQTRTTRTEEGGLIGEEFDYMIAAIEKAGMVEEYNNASITDRTHLMLNNNAFTGDGDVIDIVKGSPDIAEGATPAEVIDSADVEILKRVLQYHIVTTYVAQVPTLFEFGVNYVF